MIWYSWKSELSFPITDPVISIGDFQVYVYEFNVNDNLKGGPL